jgi:hypothetical protein
MAWRYELDSWTSCMDRGVDHAKSVGPFHDERGWCHGHGVRPLCLSDRRCSPVSRQRLLAGLNGLHEGVSWSSLPMRGIAYGQSPQGFGRVQSDWVGSTQRPLDGHGAGDVPGPPVFSQVRSRRSQEDGSGTPPLTTPSAPTSKPQSSVSRRQPCAPWKCSTCCHPSGCRVRAAGR